MEYQTILLRHLGRDANTRTVRALRSGYRWSSFCLDDGTPIRSKGNRSTEIGKETFLANINNIIEAVANCLIEVSVGDDVHALTLKQVCELAGQDIDLEKVIDHEVKTLVADIMPYHKDDKPIPPTADKPMVAVEPTPEEFIEAKAVEPKAIEVAPLEPKAIELVEEVVDEKPTSEPVKAAPIKPVKKGRK